MEDFTFEHNSWDDDGVVVTNKVNFETESLSEVLKRVRDFLIASGFTYVQHIDADCGDVIWSSDEDVNEWNNEYTGDYSEEVLGDDV